MNKKTKIITLSLFGGVLLTTGAIATSAALVSCSNDTNNKPTSPETELTPPSEIPKPDDENPIVPPSYDPTVDIIESYKDADGAKFYDENNHETIMDTTETPFKCDFDITKKICSIVEYIGNKPNYFTKGLPNIQTTPNPSNYKNTLRIPSKILYNNEEYDVISFSSFNSSEKNHMLDIDCISSSTQVIEFDNNLNSQLATNSLPHEINITASKYNNLLKISNFPNYLIFETTHYKNLEVFTFNHDYQQNNWIYFNNCSSLKSIKIPNSVTNIGEASFMGCSSLQNIDIPNSVTNIDNSAFLGCSSLQNIDIPSSVTWIGSHVFAECKSLQNINIPNSVTFIGSYAFSQCSSLKTINIPNSVTTIGDWAFSSCWNLQKIIMPNLLTVIGENTFFDCRSLQNIDIPSSVISIEDDAFGECSSLKTINIPNSVISIGMWAFNRCSSLQTINIPNSVISIGKGTFFECSSLKTINIPNSVTSIGERAFDDCLNLQNIKIPNSVTSIGGYAFSGCSNLQNVDIPNSVKNFGTRIFSVSSYHVDGFKINFYSQQTMDLFLKSNLDDAEYCQLIQTNKQLTN